MLRRVPWSIPILTALLACLGCLTIARCAELSNTGGHYVRQQVLWTALGTVAMVVAAVPNYRVLCRWSYAIFASALVLLVAVYAFPRINGAHRWIRVGPVGLQPSEFAKVAFVLAIARYLMHRENYRRLPGLMLPLAIAVVPVLLVLKEPDLGMALVFLPVLFIMLFAAGARRLDLAVLAMAGLLLLPVLWTQMSQEQRSRVTALFDQPAAAESPSDNAYHLHQAKRMMAMGDVWGSWLVGPTSDDPAAYRLPEARTDFIFCVVTERFGIVGVALVLSLYALLTWRGLAIAAATREPFGRLVAVGVTAMLAVQATINAGMNVGLLPITGLPLPLVSYGGSGMLAHAVALGLLVNVGMRPGYEMTNEPFRYRT